MFKEVELIVDKNIRSLCLKPYPNHPKGCPNWNKKDGCPPTAKGIDELIRLDKPVYLIYNKFDIGEHVYKLKQKYPNWTDRQLYCCLYWQPKARKQLKTEIEKFNEVIKNYVIISCPEASCVNITETMKQVGITLEWPPIKSAYQIVVAGEKFNI